MCYSFLIDASVRRVLDVMNSYLLAITFGKTSPKTLMKKKPATVLPEPSLLLPLP